MSIFSDHECGALSDDEFAMACARMNAEERYFKEHMYDDLDLDQNEEEEDLNER